MAADCFSEAAPESVENSSEAACLHLIAEVAVLQLFAEAACWQSGSEAVPVAAAVVALKAEACEAGSWPS